MKTALALGTFDGLHRGHREVLRLPAGMKKTAGQAAGAYAPAG